MMGWMTGWILFTGLAGLVIGFCIGVTMQKACDKDTVRREMELGQLENWAEQFTKEREQ